ncbi:hypothetical protein [Streptomyces buecherae]|uniref:hypothetical protein n=1 Tax=Streptomyces buecherae TaxID=2763006 RepID=UPI00379052E0
MDERVPRVYGADADDPDPGPEPGRVYVELIGGPLDGWLVDVTRWPADEIAEGAALITEYGAYGGGGRAWYSGRPGQDSGRWWWDGDSA